MSRNDTDDIYEEEYFESRFTYDPSKEVLWSVISEYLSKRVDLERRVLDVGAGYCYFLNAIDADQKYALDISTKPLRMADDGTEVVQGDVSSLCFSDSSVETVFASNVLEHLDVEKVLASLREIRRVLTPEGRLVIVTPNFRLAPRKYFNDFTHKTVITDEGMADMLTATGFKVVDTKVRFLPFSSEGRIPVVPLLVKIYLRLPYPPFAGQSLFIAETTE